MKRITIIIYIIFSISNIFSQNFIIKTGTKIPTARLKNVLNLNKKDKVESIFEELNLFRIHLDKKNADKIARIKRNTLISFIVEDKKIEYRTVPDDPYYPKQYAIEQIKANEVWDFNTGGITEAGDTVVIAVLDKGCETTHTDFTGNIWRNNDEIPDDGVDNDNNGYIDDYFGIDLTNKNDNHSIHYHGTGVAGIIGAKGNNNKGIAGINWNVKLLPVTSVNYVSDVLKGYDYIYKLRKKYNDTKGKHGAFVVAANLSAGQSNSFPEDSPINKEWCNIYNMLGEQGILNVTSASNDPVNVEQTGDMPTLCTSDYLIPVTSTDYNDNFDTDRSYGNKSIDIAAPGKDIFTLSRDGGYKVKFSGNSAAAPQVTGAIGLLYTLPCKGFVTKIKANPAETSLKIKEYILKYSDKHNDLADKTVSGGRLNIYKTYLHLAEDLCDDLVVNKFELKKIYPNPTAKTITVNYDIDNFDPHIITIYNAVGQKIYKTTFRPQLSGDKEKTIDISSFPTGIYYLELQSGKNSEKKVFSKF